MWVLDIKADQFGALPVVVLPLAASRDRYKPGNQADIDALVAEFWVDQAALPTA